METQTMERAAASGEFAGSIESIRSESALPFYLNKAGLAYYGGTMGTLAHMAVIWLFGLLGVPALLGVKMAVKFTYPATAAHIMWGGIWGLIFFLPYLKNRPFWQGVVFSLPPTLFTLLVKMPFQYHRPLMGIDTGMLTPLFAVFYNAVWGVATIYWLRYIHWGVNESREHA